MKTNLQVLGLSLLLASGCMVSGRGGYAVGLAPPPPRASVVVESQPGYIWVEGHWAREDADWVWVDGYWEAERPGYVWVQGSWNTRGSQHYWVGGHWTARAGAHGAARVIVR